MGHVGAGRFGFADGRYTLTPALRYDHYKPESTDSYASNPNAGKLPSANSAGRFSPKLLAGWKAADELSLYAQYAYGFKAPSPSQLYTNYGGAGTYLRVGNPYLKPETSKGWELGAKLGSDDLGGALSFFDNRYQNFIDTSAAGLRLAAMAAGLGGPVSAGRHRHRQSRPRAHLRRRGQRALEIRDRLAYLGLAGLGRGQDEGTGQHLNSVAPLKAIVGLGYGRDAWGVDAMLTAALKRDKVEYPNPTAKAPNADFQAPGYGVMDLLGYWRPEAIKGLQLQAGVQPVRQEILGGHQRADRGRDANSAPGGLVYRAGPQPADIAHVPILIR